MTFTFEIDTVSVYERVDAEDRITIVPRGVPTAHPEMQYPLSFTVNARSCYGAQWCREVLGVEPIVLNAVTR